MKFLAVSLSISLRIRNNHDQIKDISVGQVVLARHVHHFTNILTIERNFLNHRDEINKTADVYEA